MKNENEKNPSMSWNDTLTKDGRDHLILEEGDYIFTVTDLDRGTYAGGQRLSACPKATLRLEVQLDDDIAVAYVTLYLHRSVEWKLSSFFRSIGQKKRGQDVNMDWDHVVNSMGRAHFKPVTYQRDGVEKQANDVAYFIDYDPDIMNKWTEADDEELPFD